MLYRLSRVQVTNYVKIRFLKNLSKIFTNINNKNEIDYIINHNFTIIISNYDNKFDYTKS